MLLANKWSGHLGAPYGQVVWTVKFSLRSSGLDSQVLLAVKCSGQSSILHGSALHALSLCVHKT